ncbi:MAG: hypothetical protein RL748_783 [Pseudomonadota bacterium]|jgi:hypothetical protein
MTPSGLPPAPNTVPNLAGQPEFGRFVGSVAQIDWDNLQAPYQRSRWWRHFHHKRWQYVALASEQLFCGIAIIDLGWTNTAFAYAFDRKQGKEVASFAQDGVPGLTATVGDGVGQACEFVFMKNSIRMQTNAAGHFELRLDCGKFQIDASFDLGSSAPLLLAVGPIEGGAVHATQKSSGCRLQGRVKADGREYDLQDGVASFDYSNGLLARNTDWRWASAHDLQVGFNLQDGYFGTHENVLWLDGKLYALGKAHFDFDLSNPILPWHITTDDGLLDLHFQPQGMRQQNKNLLVASSRYVQPIGTFCGWVKTHAQGAAHRIDDLVGVTENHHSRW